MNAADREAYEARILLEAAMGQKKHALLDCEIHGAMLGKYQNKDLCVEALYDLEPQVRPVTGTVTDASGTRPFNAIATGGWIGCVLPPVARAQLEELATRGESEINWRFTALFNRIHGYVCPGVDATPFMDRWISGEPLDSVLADHPLWDEIEATDP